MDELEKKAEEANTARIDITPIGESTDDALKEESAPEAPETSIAGESASVTESALEHAAKPKKRKKRRLRKWARVTLGAMAAVALLGGGYAIAIHAGKPVAAVTSAPVESAQLVTSTSEASASASPSATESAVPIASEIDAQSSTADAEIAAADEQKLPLGNRGRLYIGDWSVQLNGDDKNDASALQTAADEPDSASYAEYSGKVMISDHANQGFSCIKALQVGDQITLKNADGEETALVVTATYADAYYKDGYAMLPDGTDAWKTTDGSYILQTNGDDNGDTLYIVICDEAPEESASPDASASAEPSASALAE